MGVAVCWCCGGGVAVCWRPLSAGAAGGCRLLVAAVCWCCGGLPPAGAAKGGGGCRLLVLPGLPSLGVCCLLVLWGVAVCWCLLSAGAVGGAAEGWS